jgi:hypothetical protein
MTTTAYLEVLSSTRAALTAAHQLGLQQLATPHRLPSADQTRALQCLARLALRHPAWQPGETIEALAADPIAADIWAAAAIATEVG